MDISLKSFKSILPIITIFLLCGIIYGENLYISETADTNRFDAGWMSEVSSDLNIEIGYKAVNIGEFLNHGTRIGITYPLGIKIGVLIGTQTEKFRLESNLYLHGGYNTKLDSTTSSPEKTAFEKFEERGYVGIGVSGNILIKVCNISNHRLYIDLGGAIQPNLGNNLNLFRVSAGLQLFKEIRE